MTRRLERVNELIRTELSALLIRDAKDPRLGERVISVTEVNTSIDLRHARVFVSVLGTPEEQRQTLEVLRAATGFFQHELGERLTLRRIPALSFVKDDALERGDRLLRLMREVAAGRGEAPAGQGAPGGSVAAPKE